ncbi:MAG: hypothetical protein WC735_03105 [Candidatus Paceibacterota bacterium]|jgi:hypothetical protein
MNKNKYIALFVIIVLGIIFWVLTSSKTEKTPEEVAPATISTQSVTLVTSPAVAVLAGTKTVNWQTSNYPVDAGVNINLIRKVSDSPRQFVLVRTIETNTPNDKQESWVPLSGENSADLYIQVTCSNSYVFKSGCSLSSEPIKVN